MDRFRDYEHRRNDAQAPVLDGTRRLDAAQLFQRNGGSRLN